MSDHTIYRQCQPDGPWQRLLPGIILLESSRPTADQRAVAALLYGGPSSVVTGAEACRRYGLRIGQLPIDDDLQLLVPHASKISSSDFVLIERTRRLPIPNLRRDIPLAPLVRAVLDLTRRIHESDPVSALLIEAIQRGGCSPTALAEELDIGGRRGTAIPRRCLTGIVELQSVAELHARQVSDKMRVRPSHFNRDIFGPNGEYIARPDEWWDDVAMAWEIDSYEFHFWKDRYARTVERNTRYAAAGITVVQTLPSRILAEPAAVLAELEAAYQAAAARPRPAAHLARPAA